MTSAAGILNSIIKEVTEEILNLLLEFLNLVDGSRGGLRPCLSSVEEDRNIVLYAADQNPDNGSSSKFRYKKYILSLYFDDPSLDNAEEDPLQYLRMLDQVQYIQVIL